VLDIAIHKVFTKELKNAKLNATNSGKLFIYISLILHDEKLPMQA
jgi:mRNA interferase YafQ